MIKNAGIPIDAIFNNAGIGVGGEMNELTVGHFAVGLVVWEECFLGVVVLSIRFTASERQGRRGLAFGHPDV